MSRIYVLYKAPEALLRNGVVRRHTKKTTPSFGVQNLEDSSMRKRRERWVPCTQKGSGLTVEAHGEREFRNSTKIRPGAADLLDRKRQWGSSVAPTPPVPTEALLAARKKQQESHVAPTHMHQWRLYQPKEKHQEAVQPLCVPVETLKAGENQQRSCLCLPLTPICEQLDRIRLR